jgi:hypothetical protein
MEKLSTKEVPWKKSTRFFSVPGIGMLTKEQFEMGIKMGAFVKRENAYAITTQEKLVGVDDRGRPLKNPEPVLVASDAWFKFKKLIDNKLYAQT